MLRRAATYFVALTAVILPATISGAQEPDAPTCVKAHTQAQMLRRDARLLAAREELRSCAAASCPGVVRSDCVSWMSEVEAELPTVTFQAEDDHGVVTDVQISVDGEVVASGLTGRELEVDPGLHLVAFESPGRARIERQVVLHARQKGVAVNASWRSEPVAPSTIPAPPVALPMHRPTPRLVYYLAGGGAVGGVGFAVFGLLGKREEDDLKKKCAPFCSDAEADGARAKLLAADISLGLGVASLVAAGVVYLLRPSVPVERQSAHTPRVRWSFAGGRVPSGMIRF